MFKGNVNLIKRNKTSHCGIHVRHDGEKVLISVCNGRWVCNDVTSEGSASEVTCKRCLKILEKADSNGHVKL